VDLVEMFIMVEEINNMGKLRKIGRKIKKGIKKLFSSDIGKIVGMIGMFMAMSWAGKAMKGFFKGAETAATEAAKVTTETAASTTGGGTGGTVGGGTVGGGTTTGGSQSTIMTEANTAVNQINSASVNPSIDASATIDNTVTGSLEKSVDAGVFEQPTVEVNQNLVDIESTNFLSETKGDVMNVQTGTITRPEVGTIDTSAATDLMTTKPEIAMNVNPTVNMPDESMVNPSRIEALAANTGERFSNLGQNVKNYFTDGSIVPDTITGVSTGVIMSKLQDDPEMGGGFISPPPMQEMAQGAYMQEIAPVVANVTGVPNFKSFSDMAQQTIYGVGTPNHLAGLYATPPAPTVNYG
jgi:hypothetical protein